MDGITCARFDESLDRLSWRHEAVIGEDLDTQAAASDRAAEFPFLALERGVDLVPRGVIQRHGRAALELAKTIEPGCQRSNRADIFRGERVVGFGDGQSVRTRPGESSKSGKRQIDAVSNWPPGDPALAPPGAGQLTRDVLADTTMAGQRDQDEQTLFDGVDLTLPALARFAGPNPPDDLTSDSLPMPSPSRRPMTRSRRRQHDRTAGGRARSSSPASAAAHANGPRRNSAL